jgi:hypothetical protein
MAPPVATLDALAAQEAARDALLTRTVEQLNALLVQLQQRLRGALPHDAAALARQIATLRQLIAGETTRFANGATPVVTGAQRDAVPLAQTLVDAPLAAGGLAVALPELTLPLIDALTAYAADLVTGLSTALRDQITQQIQLVVLGAQDITTAMQTIEAMLDPAGTGGLNANARAEAIARTEVGRVHSQATQRRLEQAARQVEDLMKEWRHSGLPRNPRSGHVAAHGQRVAVAAPFLVAPEVGMTRERLMYPRDPAASARNTVSCRCLSIPWVTRWADAEAAA